MNAFANKKLLTKIATSSFKTIVEEIYAFYCHCIDYLIILQVFYHWILRENLWNLRDHENGWDFMGHLNV